MCNLVKYICKLKNLYSELDSVLTQLSLQTELEIEMSGCVRVCILSFWDPDISPCTSIPEYEVPSFTEQKLFVHLWLAV